MDRPRNYQITIEPNPNHVRVRFNGLVLADTTRALTLTEARLLAVHYIPRQDADQRPISDAEKADGGALTGMSPDRRQKFGAGAAALGVPETAQAHSSAGSDLNYSDGIAAALQRRLPSGWELAPYAGDDLRGTALRGANMLVPFHEVYAVRTHDGSPAGLPQLSYIAFVSQAHNQATGALAHFHWFVYTEDAAGVPGKYGDGKLAHVTQSQTFTKERRGETQVRETFSAVADSGEVSLLLAYQQGGMLIWASADRPNLPLYAAKDPSIVRWYQEDQVLNVVRSDPLKINRVSEISLTVQGELGDVFDGNQRVVAVVIQRPYMRQVYIP